MPGPFKYEDCPLKHFVRINGWLPNCKERKRTVNAGLDRVQSRRLRYFTFCAIGAVDVLMLDVAKVLRPSATGKFDTVVFFDRDGDAVTETQKRIPGAIGFPGDFTSIVTAEGLDADDPSDTERLAPPNDSSDEIGTRDLQRKLRQRDQFRDSFPFDIINLDLEEFAFKPNDPFPGRVINSIRNVAIWQRRTRMQGAAGKQKAIGIDGFTLMFTTRVGPPNISDDYKLMLRNCISENVRRKPALLDSLRDRFDANGIAELEDDHFPDFFTLGVRKVLADILMETDWYIDPKDGIKTFEFQRAFNGGAYTILHFVMDVTRQHPPKDRRAPNVNAPAANNAYDSVIDKLFANAALVVDDAKVEDAQLRPSLDEIRARRNKYYPEQD